MSRTARAAIVGGGISGLSCAYHLQKMIDQRGLDLEVTLLEKSDRLGGVVRTVHSEGLVLEAGPEGWASYKPDGRKLVMELGLENDLIGSRDELRKTLIVRNGRLTALPDGMMFLAPVDPVAFWRSAPLSLGGKLRASLEPFVSRSQGDLSVRRFFERRLGGEFTNELVEPLINAVFGTDFEKLSAPSALPELYRAEQRAGSLWRGLRRYANLSRKISVLKTMRNGMGQITDTLERSLTGVQIVHGVDRLRLDSWNGSFRLSAANFEGVFDFLLLCTPAYASAEILKPVSSELAASLADIPYASSTLIYLAYKKSEFSHPLDGFGFIVPKQESLLVDACTWVTTKFDHRGPSDRILLRCAIHHKGGSSGSDEELAQRAHDEIRRVMELDCTPTRVSVFRVGDALPQLLVGHGRRLKRIGEGLLNQPKMVLAGSFVGGVGVPDCIKTGREAAEKVTRQLTEGTA